MESETTSKEEREFSHKGKGRSEKALVVFILILGIIIGGLLAMYLVFPEMNKQVIKENFDLKEQNKTLEKEADSIIKCLQDKGVNYYTECK